MNRLWKEKPVSIDDITGLFNTIENEFYRENPDFEPSGWSKPTTQLNYAPLPEKLKPYPDGKELLRVKTDTLDIYVDKGTRLKGTRAGIHVHESGGITFVMRGKGGITDFVNGYMNTYNPTGHYYYMPANTTMSASNFSGGNVKETLENQRHSRDNGPVIAGQDWVDGRQTARLLGLRDHHSQEADQTGEVSL